MLEVRYKILYSYIGKYIGTSSHSEKLRLKSSRSQSGNINTNQPFFNLQHLQFNH